MDASPFEIGLVREGSNGKPKKSYILDYYSFSKKKKKKITIVSFSRLDYFPALEGVMTYEWEATMVKAQYAIRFIECNNVL